MSEGQDKKDKVKWGDVINGTRATIDGKGEVTVVRKTKGQKAVVVVMPSGYTDTITKDRFLKSVNRN